jgi:diguanylate cyclase (GGDEF)-like protein
MSLRAGVKAGGYALLTALVVFASVLIVVTVAVGERVRQMYDAAETERRELLETTAVLQHRNDQMNALYTVFTEITDTLSLRYVVSATLREAIRLMNCNTAVLRLLRDGNLVVAGSLTNDGTDLGVLREIPLGSEPIGRAAKRGHPLIIGSHNQDLLGEMHIDDGTRSGLIIPLIIGARVAGTLSVWSREVDAFSEEDERILGMMGSQVATAVVAADTTEASEHRASHDPLTGLPNRLRLMEDLARDFSLLEMADRKAVVAMVDIDHFKHFNDDFGHHVGDVSLQKVAFTLRHALRDGDRVYRYGGEEFVILLMDTSGEAALALAERVRAAVESMPLTGDQLEPVGPVTISMGLAFYPADGKEFGSLIEMADLAMYRAKALGRNQIATWSRDVVSPAA